MDASFDHASPLREIVPGRFTRVSVQTPAGEIEARLSERGNWELRVRRDQEMKWRLACTGDLDCGIVTAQLPPRVRRAMWRMAYAPRIRWADMVVPILVGGIEALLKIGRRDLTQQFKKRVPALAAEIGIDGLDENLAERLYDGRSDWVHGSHVQLFVGEGAGADTSAGEESVGTQSSDERSPRRGRPASRCSPRWGSPGDRGRRVSSGLRRRRDHRGALARLIDNRLPGKLVTAGDAGTKWVLS
jgi:hypothetical protein